jgi:putative tryptophan/tyrosine transport system substrate-binding protein
VAANNYPGLSGQGLSEDGCLISYGPSYFEASRRAATYVHKILQGTRPANLPVEQPTKFDLIVNLKTAKSLGIEIPPALLARAE